MDWLYDLFIESGVETGPASWGVVIVTCLAIYSIFKVVLHLVDN